MPDINLDMLIEEVQEVQENNALLPDVNLGLVEAEEANQENVMPLINRNLHAAASDSGKTVAPSRVFPICRGKS